MEKVIEFLYLNNIALLIPVIALIVTIFVWFVSKGVQATPWLIIGVVSLGLTLPAAWTTFNLQSSDKQLLQNYIEDRAKFSTQFGEDVTKAMESLASTLGIAEKIGFDYKNLELFAYLSLAGLVGSVVGAVGYFWQSSRSSTPTTYLTPTQYQPANPQPWVQPTPDFPPTQPGANFPGQFPPATGANFGTNVPPQAPYVPTEQIGLSRGLAGSDLSGPGGNMPAKTELLNAPSAVVNAWFVVKEGVRVGKLYHLSSEATTIGRDPSNCDVVIDDTSISRQHIKVRQSKDEAGHDQFTLFDLATANGTKVNGADVSKQVLQDGDEVVLGRTVLVFKQIL